MPCSPWASTCALHVFVISFCALHVFVISFNSILSQNIGFEKVGLSLTIEQLFNYDALIQSQVLLQSLVHDTTSQYNTRSHVKPLIKPKECYFI